MDHLLRRRIDDHFVRLVVFLFVKARTAEIKIRALIATPQHVGIVYKGHINDEWTYLMQRKRMPVMGYI